jgi:hypothetical protein
LQLVQRQSAWYLFELRRHDGHPRIKSHFSAVGPEKKNALS